jgi:outer membrane receptor protein involved in Fe transport
MVYASFSHGYKGGGANPPVISPPALFIVEEASGGTPDTFEPEFINAYEVGTKNTLFGGAATLNMTAFYYDYTDYQISKIEDRRAVNENFDAEVWGLEFEGIFAPSLDWQFNAAIGYLQTKVAAGEQSIDLMDRADGGNRGHVLSQPTWIEDRDGNVVEIVTEFDEWMVVKPWVTTSANCIAPTAVVEEFFEARDVGGIAIFDINVLCPVGNAAGRRLNADFADIKIIENGEWVGTLAYAPGVHAPNGGAGFFKDLGGNELPNAPHFTVALGGQYNFDLTRDWQATARVDYYWQDESYARVYNTEFDRLKSWSNTNLSFWVTNPQWGVTVEAYVKNAFGETPITGTFLNSDDSGLTTNVFTLDPRLYGVSIRKEF